MIDIDSYSRQRLLIGYGLCLPLALVFYLVGSAGHDDSHITFWQAWSLNHHGALLNYNGERIEQSSSLLHVLLTALMAQLSGMPEAFCGYAVSLLSGIGTLLLCYRIAIQQQFTAPWSPALLTGCSIYFSYWACSGMESTLTALCALLFISQSSKLIVQPTSLASILSALLSSALLAAVRPEMPLVGAAWLLILAALYPAARHALLTLLLPFILLALWRYHYFGQWFPNPVYAKSRGTELGALLEQWQSGWQYLLRLGRHPALLCLSLLFGSACLLSVKYSITALRQQQPSPLLPWLLWVGLYAGFVIASGGDWMKEGRFWVPLIAPAALVTGHVICSFGTSIRWLVLVITVLLQLIYANAFLAKFNGGMHWQQQAQWQQVFPYSSFFERSNREHVRDLPAIAELEYWVPRLYSQEQRAITLMSKQMGLVNYTLGTEFLGKFTVMDMAGLVENRLRDCDVLSQDGFEQQGMRLNYRKFFDRLPQAQSRCGINAPDIIYDIYGWGETTPLPEYLATQGYKIVFRQTGRVNMKPGADVTAYEMIAIKQSLLSTIQRKTVTLDFNRLLEFDHEIEQSR